MDVVGVVGVSLSEGPFAGERGLCRAHGDSMAVR